MSRFGDINRKRFANPGSLLRQAAPLDFKGGEHDIESSKGRAPAVLVV